MKDLQVALLTARNALACQNNLWCCDIYGGCPHCAACERGNFLSDTSDAIKLLDAAIEKYCRPAAEDEEVSA